MSKDLVVVSNNAGKIKEFKNILKDFNVLSLKDLNLDIDVVEDGETFEENAILKVKALMNDYDYVIADDSGLEILSLDNQPGVYSARFLGENTPYHEKNDIVISMLEDKEDRTAKFISVIAFAKKQEIFLFRGELSGQISFKQAGENGFGYDPIFYLPKYNKTMAEISVNLKDEISHRAISLAKLKEFLRDE